jgi:hypothetical protein
MRITARLARRRTTVTLRGASSASFAPIGRSPLLELGRLGPVLERDQPVEMVVWLSRR